MLRRCLSSSVTCNAEVSTLERISPHQTMATITNSPSGKTVEQKDFPYGQHEARKEGGTKRASSKGLRREAHKLLGSLNYDPSVMSRDVDYYLRLGEAFEEGKKARAAAMIKHAKFEEFMAEYLASSSLLINGRADIDSLEGISPLSYVAAKLAAISERVNSPSGPPYVVKYFCNQHPPFVDSSTIPSPVTMMVSLVGQLLTQMIENEVDVDLSVLTKRDWQDVEKSNLRVLCRIFRELTNQLPPKSVVLCILDDLAQYKIGPFMDDTDTITRRLTRLAAGHDQ